jgi:hypothetical protein
LGSGEGVCAGGGGVTERVGEGPEAAEHVSGGGGGWVCWRGSRGALLFPSPPPAYVLFSR